MIKSFKFKNSVYMKKIIVSLILIFNVIFLFSQNNKIIQTAVPSLMISPDARASGLGEQGVATSPDTFSQHWNPAKYVFLEKTFLPQLIEYSFDFLSNNKALTRFCDSNDKFFKKSFSIIFKIDFNLL